MKQNEKFPSLKDFSKVMMIIFIVLGMWMAISVGFAYAISLIN